MLNISKNGNTVYILYGAKNYATGQTVVAEIYDEANNKEGADITLNEIGTTGLYGNTFTPNATGNWKIKVKEGTQYRAHAEVQVGAYDVEAVGGDVTTIKGILENVTYGNSALKTLLDSLDTKINTVDSNVDTINTNTDTLESGQSSIQSDLTNIEGSGFNSGSDSLKAIKDYLVQTIQSSISGISNNINTAVAIPAQMLRPQTSSTAFKIYVNVYDASGNMEDANDQDPGSDGAYVSVAVTDEQGNDRSSNLSGLSSSTFNSLKWLTRDSEGRYSFTYAVSSTHDLEELIFTFSYEEGGAQQVDTIVAEADSSGSLNNDYWWFFTENKSYYVWYNVNSGGTDPNPTVPVGAPATKTGIEVAISTDATADAVASATRNQITTNAPEKTVSGSTSSIVLTHNVEYDIRDAEDGNTSWSSISTTTAGSEGASRVVDRASVVTDSVDVEADVDYIRGEVDSVTYGLSALKTLIDTVDTVVDGIQTDLDNPTDGLGAIKTAVDANQSDLTNIETKIDTVDSVVDSNYSLLSNGTYGLSALKALIDGIDVNTDQVEADLTSIKQKDTGGSYDADTMSLQAVKGNFDVIKGATFNSTTDSLEAIRDSIDGIDVGNGGYIG